tara:strand:+ start:2209 stop:3084 length:876 start_codon:yes stop_codon:yes gene_type:complete
MKNIEPRYQAIAWMLFASVAFGSMNALVKWTSSTADVWSMVMVRSVVITLGIYLIATHRGVNLRVNDRKNMFLRCATGLIAMILYFTALGLIPIGQAVTLQYTNPLFVALLSGLFLSESVGIRTWGLALASFFGIALIVSPDLRTIDINALYALGSGFFAAVAYLYVRMLRSSEHALSIVFWFALFSVIFTTPPAILNLKGPLSEPKIALALICIGIGAGAGQVGLTYAFHKANAAWVSAFSYVTVIVATGYGYFFFGESLDNGDIIGCLLIIVSGILLTLSRSKRNNAES